jgi:hypothetical protein
MPRKPGRPKVPKSKALGTVFGARLRANDEKLVSNAIERSGQKQSAWIRDALLEKARKR